jgi:hypothetical protein
MMLLARMYGSFQVECPLLMSEVSALEAKGVRQQVDFSILLSSSKVKDIKRPSSGSVGVSL